MSITTRQKQLLDFIEQFRRQEGLPPSLRDMCRALGLVSPGSLLRHLQILESQGYLTRIPGKKRTWKSTNQKPVNSIPLLGRIAAGQPILAEQHVEDNLPFDPNLFGSSDAFALTVKGDSMIGLQIRDGDIAIIRPQKEVESGEITAVIVEGVETEATLKVFCRRNDDIELHAANPIYEPLVFKGRDRTKIRILGKLVGVVRLKP
ncbi:MAG: transcriptional repressor LexA [Desulfomonilaceae bacterium]